MPAIAPAAPIGMTLPNLKGCYFFCKGTNKRMRDLARKPMANGSVIRITDDCAHYEIIADEPVKPTSNCLRILPSTTTSSEKARNTKHRSTLIRSNSWQCHTCNKYLEKRRGHPPAFGA